MVLVTGGAGFIGSHIVDILISNNYSVVIVDNLSSGKKDNINNKAIFYEVDIKDYQELEKVFIKEDIEYIIHLSAQVSVPSSMRDPINDAKENILATINVLDLAKKYNIKKIIVSSSAAVYGNPIYFPIREDHRLESLSYYSLSKITMEKYIELYGIDYIICRFSNVYGPRQTAHGEAGVVSIFIDNIISYKEINIFGDGNQTRDFIYVLDIANIFLEFLNKNIVNKIVNISTNISTTINDLYKTLTIISNREVKVNYLNTREGDIKNSVLDNSLLLSLIDFNFTDINLGLKSTYQYFYNKVVYD